MFYFFFGIVLTSHRSWSDMFDTLPPLLTSTQKASFFSMASASDDSLPEKMKNVLCQTAADKSDNSYPGAPSDVPSVRQSDKPLHLSLWHQPSINLYLQTLNIISVTWRQTSLTVHTPSDMHSVRQSDRPPHSSVWHQPPLIFCRKIRNTFSVRRQQPSQTACTTSDRGSQVNRVYPVRHIFSQTARQSAATLLVISDHCNISLSIFHSFQTVPFPARQLVSQLILGNTALCIRLDNKKITQGFVSQTNSFRQGPPFKVGQSTQTGSLPNSTLRQNFFSSCCQTACCLAGNYR